MTTKRRNARSLDAIADDIYKLDRGNIIDIGNLLTEARLQCEHGQWLDWLEDWFEMSDTTATRYMKVAEVVDKFPKLKNLRLPKTALYALSEHDDQEELPVIIVELAKHATKTRIKPAAAERIITIGIGRRRFGNLPDATLYALVTAPQSFHKETVAALLEHLPETDEAADLIVNETIDRKIASPDNDDAEEIEDILDGAPPVLPPPTSPPEPQKLSADTDWAETGLFAHAVSDLQALITKPAKRFARMFTTAELHEVADFLLAVDAAQSFDRDGGSSGVIASSDAA